MALTQILESLVYFWIQLFVIFPYSALTIQRQRLLLTKAPTEASVSRKRENIMISDKVYALCTGTESVSGLLAKNSTLPPEDAWKQLFKDDHIGDKESVSTAKANRDDITPEDLQRARECGNWGPTEPSDLFLRIYHDAICTIDRSVSGCMVSPSLMGSHGVIPLTVISVVPDIMRHMSNLIVRAKKEVVLATNYWQNSVASKYITDAMRELSKRAGERGERIVFKLEYDRGSAKQVIENHYIVSPKEYMGKAVALPAPEDIPNIDLQVINYHRPMLGTFHCKYMIVDRTYAVLQSNNIQDNDNLEMMTHLEGPIVDSLYDMALISWAKALEPPLPCHNSPATERWAERGGEKQQAEASVDVNDHEKRAVNNENRPETDSYQPRGFDQKQTNGVNGNTNSSIPIRVGANGSVSQPDQDRAHEVNRTAQDQANGNSQDSSPQSGHKPKNFGPVEILQENARAIAVTGDAEHAAKTREEDQKEGPLGHPVQRATQALSGNETDDDEVSNQRGINTDLTVREYFYSARQDKPESHILQPLLSKLEGNHDRLLPEHTTDDPHYDIDIASEVARVQSAVSPSDTSTRMQAVTRHLNHTKNPGFKGTAPECDEGDEMTPYIPHAADKSFPIAMVCREPYGTPNHRSVYNPQNEAWLSALRNAKESVFIQSPTLNAEPLVPAIIEACERGVQVYCYICLGYNDTGELLPMQGGTNEMVSSQLHKSLSPSGLKNLHYNFYIGKDQTSPLVARLKQRDCHIKVMIVDRRIGIQGNGNQDTQSWFHSQEINVMFESADVCVAWIDALRRNQNTLLYGEVGREDGVWRDEEGKEARGVIGVDPGRFSWLKGFAGAVNRVRGTGDF